MCPEGREKTSPRAGLLWGRKRELSTGFCYFLTELSLGLCFPTLWRGCGSEGSASMPPAQAASCTTATRSSEGSVRSLRGLLGSELGLVTQNRYIHCQLTSWERQGRPGCLAYWLSLISVTACPQRRHTGKPLRVQTFPLCSKEGLLRGPPL